MKVHRDWTSYNCQYLALPIPHLRVQTSQMPVHMLRFYQMTQVATSETKNHIELHATCWRHDGRT